MEKVQDLGLLIGLAWVVSFVALIANPSSMMLFIMMVLFMIELMINLLVWSIMTIVSWIKG